MIFRLSLQKVVQCSLVGSLVVFTFYINFIQNRLNSRNLTKTDTFHLDFTEGQIQVDDPKLLQHLRNSVLQTPSDGPYNLSYTKVDASYESSKFYTNYSRTIFSETKDGFFVEAGAFDGELMSNTLRLEMDRGWHGLLVEPSPKSYRQLRSKNRKAWSANCCLSESKRPTQATLYHSAVRLRRGSPRSNKWVYISSPSFQKQSENSTEMIKNNENFVYEPFNITCYPLESLLLALGVTSVDLLSLDVEYVEEKILRAFDFDSFDIQVIFIEWNQLDKSRWLLDYMEKRRYLLVDNMATDFIFVKSGTKYELVVKEKNLFHTFKEYEEYK